MALSLKGEAVFIEHQLTFSGETRKNKLEHVSYLIQAQQPLKKN